MTERLNAFVAPSLPLAHVEYEQTLEEQYRKIERLYYRQISNTVNALIGSQGGRHLEMPHGNFYDTTTQSDGANTPNAVKFNGTKSNETAGIYIENNGSGDPTQVTVEYQGSYNFQFSMQLENTDNAVHSVGIWVRINGVDVNNTCTEITVPARKSALIYGYAVAAWNFLDVVQAGDYWELMWATNSTFVTLPYIPAWVTPAQPYNRPATPSALLTVNYVSVI